MRVVILGAGPAGLYCALLLKKAQPDWDIRVVERNPADATYGWGVVFSDRTLSAFREADHPTYQQITDQFVLWDAIDMHFRGELLRCGGHVFAGLARKLLLGTLQRRCVELGVALCFECEVSDPAALAPYDLLIAADGVNSVTRARDAAHFGPRLRQGRARYIWFGTDLVLDAFTFIFRENEHGFFQVHAYPFSGTLSTFIVECDEQTWSRAGLDQAGEAESIAYCERLFAPELHGRRLLSNNSKWISFPTLTCAAWHSGNTVLLGDSAHTAHFSIGSGTKLAMEDAIALANNLAAHAELEAALNAYELERRPVVETFQQAARESQAYFEQVGRYRDMAPAQFSANLLTRSGRVSYDDLRLRDPHYVARTDRWFARTSAAAAGVRAPMQLAAPPAFAPLRLRGLLLENRLVAALVVAEPAEDGAVTEAYAARLAALAQSGAGLVLTGMVAVAPEGRITPATAGLYRAEQAAAWARVVARVRDQGGPVRLGLELGHAGPRGATRPRAQGLDRPLGSVSWQLVGASPLPYAARSQTPAALDEAGMRRVREAFALAARLAAETGFDLLQLQLGHGYLLGSFLSPLTNRREDAYGGALTGRMRFPLEVVEAVRAVWPAERPLAVALNAADCAPGGMEVEEAVGVARALAERGCDLLTVQAGQTVPYAEPPYGRGFLTPLSDRLRNDAGVPTLVGGYLTTLGEVNTSLAAGRADLCRMELAEVDEPVGGTRYAHGTTQEPDKTAAGAGARGRRRGS